MLILFLFYDLIHKEYIVDLRSNLLSSLSEIADTDSEKALLLGDSNMYYLGIFEHLSGYLIS